MMKLSTPAMGILAATVMISAPLAVAGGNQESHQGMQMQGQQQAPETATGLGEIRAIGEDGENIRLYHEPMPELNWPAMVMRFQLAEPELVEGLQQGDRVQFTLRETGESGEYEIVEISPAE